MAAAGLAAPASGLVLCGGASRRGSSQLQFCSVVGTGRISMQSTGQGSTQRSQPVHSAAITVCICFAAPRIASTGQAWMHLVQPMHSSSRMKATMRGFSAPCSASSAGASTCSRSASALMVACPPGGHLLMASPAAIASA